jgi:hypothetical protein
MKQIIISLIIFLWSTSFLGAQTICEFEYEFPGNIRFPEKYRAFFIRNENGEGFFRIKFTGRQDNQERIFQLGFTEYFGDLSAVTGQPVDSSKLLIGTDNPVLIKGPAYSFYQDYFLLEQLGNDTVYTLLAVARMVNKDGKEEAVMGTITDKRLLNEKDLDRELLLQYFTGSDEIFKNLFEQEALVMETRNQVVSSSPDIKMNLIFVANTNDGKVGRSCEVDKNKITSRFSSIAKWLKIGFGKTEIFGDNYQVKNVMNAVNNLHAGKDDICIFYYSGHGFNYNKLPQKFPFLDLRENDMEEINSDNTPNIEMIYNRLVAKNFRLTLVVSDCCNSDIGFSSVPSPNEIVMKPSVTGFSVRNGNDLFLSREHKAYLFTACSKGELSAGNGVDGGIFTHNFRETLEYYLGNFKSHVSWEQIWKDAREQTAKKAALIKCFDAGSNKINSCRQTPLSLLDGKN